LLTCAPKPATFQFTESPGKDGADGSNGVDGNNGVNGVDGKHGIDGINGIDGAPGDLPIGAQNLMDCGHDYILFSSGILILSESGVVVPNNHLGLWSIEQNRDFGLLIAGVTTCSPVRFFKCNPDFYLDYRKSSDGQYYRFKLNSWTDNSDYQDNPGNSITSLQYGVCPL
jgi:hypothetical protein